MSPLQSRLSSLHVLDENDSVFMERLLGNVRDYRAGEEVQAERSPVDTTRILLSGWAMRFQTTADGDRQVINFLLPGDTIALYGALCESSDSGIQLITDCRLAEFPSEELLAMFRDSPRLGAALCWIGGQDERYLEQQILRLGLMNATTRIAHLLVELQRRMLAAGFAAVDAMTVPLTQKLIADALGLSPVHVNRCCRQLAKQGLLETGPRGFMILDPEGLKQACDYQNGSLKSHQIQLETEKRQPAH
ncbi:MAG: Crp/Fnr family transcriptional regulator [Candidatus Wenzhouxiangella sp. M2_3B_020]